MSPIDWTGERRELSPMATARLLFMRCMTADASAYSAIAAEWGVKYL